MVREAGRSSSGSVSRRAMSRMWAAPLLVLSLAASSRRTAAQPSSNSDCALMVPLDEVRRGKGAFLSDCSTLSENNLGGCWTQTENLDTEGCQTCYIAEDSFADALFPAMFSEELDPCPTFVDFTTLYEEEYGAISLVTAASLTSSACPEGWLFFSSTDHCYFKSPNTEKSADQSDAATKCEAEGAWLIAIDSEEENSFLVHNMLWIGFFGETYTGMIKTDGSSDWAWPADAVGGSSDYDCLVDYSDWIEGEDLGCASEYNNGAEGASCMEIFPYEPKGWNPFSCNVGKHYVCEMPSSGDSSSGSTSSSTDTATPSPAPTAAESTLKPTTEPTDRPTATPAPTTGEPTTSEASTTARPIASATAEPTESITPEPTVSAPPEPTTSTTADPTASATAEPTESATPEPTVSATPELTASTTADPTASATAEPTASATDEPTASATAEPTMTSTSAKPTNSATAEPTAASTTAEPTTNFTTKPSVSATTEPTASPTVEPIVSVTSEPTSSVTSEPTATVEPSVTASTAGPTAEVAAPTAVPTAAPTLSTLAETLIPSPTAPPSSPTAASDWEGYNTLTVTKTGAWEGASYSIYFVPGEGVSEIPVVEGVPNEGLGASEDDYGVKPGCYRILVEVTSGADPTGVSWEISGGQPARPGDDTSGEGLEGTLLTVGGGVCGVGSCHAECLADTFSSEDSSTSISTDVCDGYASLITGVCSGVCSEENGEDQAAFQDRCVSASCEPEGECRVDITAEDSILQVDYSLELDVLLVSSASLDSSTNSSSGSGDGDSKEFEMSVAFWLGVDSEDVTVTAVNGVEIDGDVENESASSITSASYIKGSSARRLELAAAAAATVTTVQERGSSDRALQDGGSTSSTSTEKEYTRYYCSVAPEDASSSDVQEFHDSATYSNATSGLQAWLSENGGSAWTGAEVVEIDAQVLETMYIIPMSGDFSGDEESAGQSKSDPSVSGGIVAGAVVVGVALLIVVVATCIMFRRKRSKAKAPPTAEVVISRDYDREEVRGDSGNAGGQILVSYDDAVPVPPAPSGSKNSASQGHKVFEQAQDDGSRAKAIESTGVPSAPSLYHLTSASDADADGATATVKAIVVNTDSAAIVGESRESSYYSSSCSSLAPLDPYRGSGGSSNSTGLMSTSKQQQQQQQRQDSMKDSTFHESDPDSEGVGNLGRSSGIGAGRPSVDMELSMSESDGEDDRYSGDGFLSEGSGRDSMAGASEAASRFGVVGARGAKRPQEVFTGNNWGTKPPTRAPSHDPSTVSNSRTPVKEPMARGNSISSSSSSSSASASEVDLRGVGPRQQQQHQKASHGGPLRANPPLSNHDRYPSTLSDDSDAASSAAWGSNFPRSLSQRQQQQYNQQQGERTPTGDQDSDCESRPATHQEHHPRDTGLPAIGYSYSGRVGFKPTISESWSGLPGMEDDSDVESGFYGDAEKGRRRGGHGMSSRYV